MSMTIFIDVDGTLCSRDGSVPHSARQAIKTARENGHKVFLCTGRSKPELSDDILSIGIDGAICAGGGYIEVGEKVLFHKLMEEQDVINCINYFKKYNIEYYLESNLGFMSSKNCASKIIEIFTQGKTTQEKQDSMIEIKWFLDILEEQKVYPHDLTQVNKMVFINNTVPFEDIKKHFGSIFSIFQSSIHMFGSGSGELAINGCNKYSSIIFLQQQLGFDMKKTIAFGDSYNDIDMFKVVNHSVAMENAPQDVKDYANEVTDTAENNGIYNGFLKNRLI